MKTQWASRSCSCAQSWQAAFLERIQLQFAGCAFPHPPAPPHQLALPSYGFALLSAAPPPPPNTPLFKQRSTPRPQMRARHPAYIYIYICIPSTQTPSEFMYCQPLLLVFEGECCVDVCVDQQAAHTHTHHSTQTHPNTIQQKAAEGCTAARTYAHCPSRGVEGALQATKRKVLRPPAEIFQGKAG